MNILISGTSSGLGKYLLQHLGGIAFDRHSMMPRQQINADTFDAIIHCAVEPAVGPAKLDTGRYVADSLKLTQHLLSIPHRYFIFMSSIDVYAISEGAIDESWPVVAEDACEPYAAAKCANEALLLDGNSPSNLILRISAMLGIYARPSTTIRLLLGEAGPFSLAAASNFNFIEHETVAVFIKTAIERQLSGVYNICSRDAVTLAQVAQKFGLSPEFGSYIYRTADLINDKAGQYVPALQQRSIEVLEKFWRNNKDTFT